MDSGLAAMSVPLSLICLFLNYFFMKIFLVFFIIFIIIWLYGYFKFFRFILDTKPKFF